MKARQESFRTLWQETADLMFPREDQIQNMDYPGRDKTARIYDTTAIQDSQGMASGLSAALVPAGQPFFAITVQDPELAQDKNISRYLAEITELTHTELFKSNFMLQFNETLRSLVVLGTGNLFSQWKNGLNFKDYDISFYQIKENSAGIVDSMFLTFPMTARQALQEFGRESLGEEVLQALEKDDKRDDKFEFIHVVQPRSDRKPGLQDNQNMPFESVFVDVKGKKIVSEGGFEEFPFGVPRWMKSSAEIYGRGQGTEVLSDVKVMQQIKYDFIECGNRWNKPPLEVDQNFEGEVNTTPGALNFVQKPGMIQAIQGAALGSFPVTREMLEFQQEIIHKAFFKDVFVPLADLTARMTTVEVVERMREGLRRLGPQVARLQSELLNPVIMRSVLLLMRNGRLPLPPPQLEGRGFGLEYMGELPLALRNQHSKGFLQFAGAIGELSQIFPEVVDYVNVDKAMPALAASMGVKVEHVATPEEVEEKQRIRAEQQAAMQAAAMGEQIAKGYGQTTKAPEEGSAAGQVMEAMNA